MLVQVHFYSYFKEITGCATTDATLPAGAAIRDLLDQLHQRFPKLKAMERSTLIAVGLDYRAANEGLNDGDEVSLFPPVQGG